jgi:hypothetical protein
MWLGLRQPNGGFEPEPRRGLGVDLAATTTSTTCCTYNVQTSILCTCATRIPFYIRALTSNPLFYSGTPTSTLPRGLRLLAHLQKSLNERRPLYFRSILQTSQATAEAIERRVLILKQHLYLIFFTPPHDRIILDLRTASATTFSTTPSSLHTPSQPQQWAYKTGPRNSPP